MHFTLDEISTEEFTVGGGGIFHRGEQDIPVLFEKQAEIIPCLKGCPLLDTLLFTPKFVVLSIFFRMGAV